MTGSLSTKTTSKKPRVVSAASIATDSTIQKSDVQSRDGAAHAATIGRAKITRLLNRHEN